MCADAAPTACEKCKPYSLENCCAALPCYAAALTVEVTTLQKSRREEVEHVLRAISGPTAAPAHPPGAPAADPPAASPAHSASKTVGSSTPPRAAAAAAPPPPAAAAGEAVAHAGAVVGRPPAADAPAQAADLQQLLEQLRIADKSADEQKQFITAQSEKQFKILVPDKQQRALLSAFARGPPAVKKGKGKERKAEVASGQPLEPACTASAAAASEPSSARLADADQSASAIPCTAQAPAASPASVAAAADSAPSFVPALVLVSAPAPGPNASPVSTPPLLAVDSAPNAAHASLAQMFCAAGVVPVREYQEFAQKLIDESFTSESVARRGLREDPDFFGHVLSSIGMKIGQRSCITRYLDPPSASAAAAAAGGGGSEAASADPEVVALSNLKSLCASAGVMPPSDHETIARLLIAHGVADGISLRASLCSSPPAFDLKGVVPKRGQYFAIMDYLDKPS
jgi:hypothetical protein